MDTRKTAEWWLVQFGTQLCVFMLVVFIILFAVTPIGPDRPLFIEVPVARSGGQRPPSMGDVVISISADGTLYVGAEVASLERVRAAVRETSKPRPVSYWYWQPEIRVQVDRRATFGQVRAVTRILAEEQRPRFLLLVAPPSPGLRMTASIAHRAPPAGIHIPHKPLTPTP
jgi:biopolymer transport protein ExbD